MKTIFVQTSHDDAKRHLREVAAALKGKCEKAAALLVEAADDVLAYMTFPSEHWRQIHSTNPLERLNREIRRRTRVIGIFPHASPLDL